MCLRAGKEREFDIALVVKPFDPPVAGMQQILEYPRASRRAFLDSYWMVLWRSWDVFLSLISNHALCGGLRT
jgi:hypothetical protein